MGKVMIVMVCMANVIYFHREPVSVPCRETDKAWKRSKPGLDIDLSIKGVDDEHFAVEYVGESDRDKVLAWLAKLRTKICGRCYDEVDGLYPANCGEKPERLKGQPIGQYHCPDCGAMVLAGLPHPGLCKRCAERKHPAYDKCMEEG